MKNRAAVDFATNVSTRMTVHILNSQYNSYEIVWPSPEAIAEYSSEDPGNHDLGAKIVGVNRMWGRGHSLTIEVEREVLDRLVELGYYIKAKLDLLREIDLLAYVENDGFDGYLHEVYAGEYNEFSEKVLEWVKRYGTIRQSSLPDIIKQYDVDGERAVNRRVKYNEVCVDDIARFALLLYRAILASSADDGDFYFTFSYNHAFWMKGGECASSIFFNDGIAAAQYFLMTSLQFPGTGVWSVCPQCKRPLFIEPGSKKKFCDNIDECKQERNRQYVREHRRKKKEGSV